MNDLQSSYALRGTSPRDEVAGGEKTAMFFGTLPVGWGPVTEGIDTKQPTEILTEVGESEQLRFSAAHEQDGITRVMVETFHVDGFRYSSLADAVAQARRRAARN